MKNLIIILLSIAAWALFFSCRKTKDYSAPTLVNFETPAGWPSPLYDFAANPLTAEGIALGRKLFYDGILSKDGNYPCASCHQQVAAFGTYDHDLSHGYNHSHTIRNAPPLHNLAWQQAFLADGRAATLHDVILQHINAGNEMAETTDNAVKKLKAATGYKALFGAAFGNEEITPNRITQALSQFLLTMSSANSKYDKMKRGEYIYTLPESLGYGIYQNKCAACHTEPLFTDFSYHNIGFPLNSMNDWGRMSITHLPADSLKFKTPSLRNCMVSYPYAHDGHVFDTYAMLEHYNSQVVDGPTTDPLVKNKIPLSNFEKGQLVAFFMTLTDSSFLQNKALGPLP